MFLIRKELNKNSLIVEYNELLDDEQRNKIDDLNLRLKKEATLIYLFDKINLRKEKKKRRINLNLINDFPDEETWVYGTSRDFI
ncbi:hypothetical protein BpHYR1_028103 [Brachionus plicatilis]|uniref:Uncharacterized protein n=1 Tax=Brachionus plicatilis TaxID=10195 RepID=A0A3M7R9S5_BRAPC|nr:hypothetical protein BpHYR1_028103 [Brachionus plicatilis]